MIEWCDNIDINCLDNGETFKTKFNVLSGKRMATLLVVLLLSRNAHASKIRLRRNDRADKITVIPNLTTDLTG